MTNEEHNKADSRRTEESRGIFVLGTLAMLLASRNYYVDVEIYFGKVPVPVVFFANLILFFWGIYTFSIALSLSDEYLPDFVCDLLVTIGQVFFGLGSLFIVIFFSIFLIAGYIDKIWAISLPIIPFLLFYIKKNYQEFKSKNAFNFKSINRKRLSVQLSLLGFFTSYLSLFMNVVGVRLFQNVDLIASVLFSLGFALLTSILHSLGYLSKQTKE